MLISLRKARCCSVKSLLCLHFSSNKVDKNKERHDITVHLAVKDVKDREGVLVPLWKKGTCLTQGLNISFVLSMRGPSHCPPTPLRIKESATQHILPAQDTHTHTHTHTQTHKRVHTHKKARR